MLHDVLGELNTIHIGANALELLTELSATKSVLSPTELNVQILQLLLHLDILESPLSKAFENYVPC